MVQRKLLFISNMAAPYQVKFCYALQSYFNAEFWFYVHLERNRPRWWEIPLGNKCKILKNSFFVYGLNYNNIGLFKTVKEFEPDILILGGFNLPGHYILKRWAKRNKIQVIVLSERISLKDLNPVIRKSKVWLKKWTCSLFKDIDLLFAMGDEPYRQFINDFGFNPEKVIIMQYPQDIDENLKHKLRDTKPDATLIFPSKLDVSYNPLFALEVFSMAKQRYPELKMRMNAMGELRPDCERFINSNRLNDAVSFLESIKAWDELPGIYAKADIAIFTATDSNGPNSLIECMASGMGILLSKHIYNTEGYALHDENCFRLELNHSDYINALDQYLSIPSLLKEHGKRAKDMTRNRSINATARLYNDLLNN